VTSPEASEKELPGLKKEKKNVMKTARDNRGLAL
jgi:hypothetical protein